MSHFRPFSDLLEPRILLSAEIDEDEVLRVNGTTHSDAIIIKVNGDKIVVKENGNNTKFDIADARKIKMRGREGDDELDCRNSPLKCNIEGGDEDDTIHGSNLSDRLLGDNGEDIVKGYAGDDTIEGGDFPDTLKGGAGNDAITGDDGADRLFGEDGDDLLESDDNLWEDDVIGGAGNDRAEVDDDDIASDDVDEVEDVVDD